MELHVATQGKPVFFKSLQRFVDTFSAALLDLYQL